MILIKKKKKKKENYPLYRHARKGENNKAKALHATF